jgi:hypothetical protein
LNAQHLDAIHDASHHMNRVCIQDEQGHNGGVFGVLPWDKNFANLQVQGFVHPGFCLAGVDAFLCVCLEFFFSIHPPAFPLKIGIGHSNFPLG